MGEIYDEDDEIITNIIKLDDSRYEVAGDMSLDDMLDVLGLDEDMAETDYTSVGGWVTDVMEHIPEQGETAETGIFRLTAAESTNRMSKRSLSRYFQQKKKRKIRKNKQIA